jgi:solute:Na+ symporter, SSS family
MNPLYVQVSIVALYLVGITLYGLQVGKREAKTKEGYFLGGRSFSWPLIGFSLFATNINSASVIGESGLASKIGLAASNNELMGGIMLGVSAIFFIPLYLRSRLYTIPEFLEKRFNRVAKLFFSFNFVVQSILATPIGFYAGGLAVLHIFGLDPKYLLLVCVIMGVSIGIYSVFGGLASIVYTDRVQASLLILGCLVITVVGLHRIGGPTALYEHLGPGYFEFLRPAEDPHMPWTTLPGIALHSAFFAFCSVAVLQRALGARSVHDAKMGMLLGSFLKIVTVFMLAIPGMIAAKLYPGAGDSAMPVLVRELLPSLGLFGLLLSGLVLAGLISAVMSSADAGVCAISSVIALDIYPSCSRKAVNEPRALFVGKLAAALIMVYGTFAAPYYGKLGPIYLMILQVGGFMLLPVGTCFILGRFSRRVNEQGAVATLALGLVVSVAYIVGTKTPWGQSLMPEFFVQAHFYKVYPFFFLFYVIFLYGVSLLFPAPGADKLAVLEAGPAVQLAAETSRPWYGTFKFWWFIFLGCVVALYAIF